MMVAIVILNFISYSLYVIAHGLTVLYTKVVTIMPSIFAKIGQMIKKEVKK